MTPNKQAKRICEKVNDDEDYTNPSPSKRPKSCKNDSKYLIKTLRKSCEQETYKMYSDFKSRLLLDYIPSCILKSDDIASNDTRNTASKISEFNEEIIFVEIGHNQWLHALEVCKMCITPTQYLSSDVLMELLMIMMRVQDNSYLSHNSHTAFSVVDQCQHVIQQNIKTHPPSPTNKTLSDSYKNFLISPLFQRKNYEIEAIDQSRFEYKKGILKYCLNRLEDEIDSKSEDKCLVVMPISDKMSYQDCIHNEEKYEIYECLPRKERIDRLMAVLESIVDLLQLDLARRLTNPHPTDSNKSKVPLTAQVLWPRLQGYFNENCKQISGLFAQLIHLRYPKRHIRIMTMWLNTVIHTCYILDGSSDMNYPNIEKKIKIFADKFFEGHIKKMPHDSVIRILKEIKPTYMKHLIGIRYLQMLLQTEEQCIIEMFINFLKSEWKKYPNEGNLELCSDIFHTKKKIEDESDLLQLCDELLETNELESDDKEDNLYAKKGSVDDTPRKITSNDILQILYVTLEAFLDAYSVLRVIETRDKLNNGLNVDNTSVGFYSVSDDFVKKYMGFDNKLKELKELFQEWQGNATAE